MNLSNVKNDELTLLAVHVHPDDESISTIELEAAVKVLAVEKVYFLGYRDSGMAGSPENHHPQAYARADIRQATARLVEIIRRVRPQVIVTYNEKGTYLHPDHIMANRVTLRAFQASGDAHFEIGEALELWQPAKLYYTAIPLERIRRMHRIVKERGEEPGLDPDVIGTAEGKISTVVDVREYLSQKLEALNCHQSQLNPNSVIRRMSEELREEFMGYEHFECVQGCPAAGNKETDLFEGLYPN